MDGEEAVKVWSARRGTPENCGPSSGRGKSFEPVRDERVAAEQLVQRLLQPRRVDARQHDVSKVVGRLHADPDDEEGDEQRDRAQRVRHARRRHQDERDDAQRDEPVEEVGVPVLHRAHAFELRVERVEL